MEPSERESGRSSERKVDRKWLSESIKYDLNINKTQLCYEPKVFRIITLSFLDARGVRCTRTRLEWERPVCTLCLATHMKGQNIVVAAAAWAVKMNYMSYTFECDWNANKNYAMIIIIINNVINGRRMKVVLSGVSRLEIPVYSYRNGWPKLIPFYFRHFEKSSGCAYIIDALSSVQFYCCCLVYWTYFAHQRQ